MLYFSLPNVSLSLLSLFVFFLLLNYILCDLYRYVYEGKKKKKIYSNKTYKKEKEKLRKHEKIYEYQDTKNNLVLG